MERLKAILADKVLDLSIGSGEEVKAKIDKIQRFRDFANACQTLMKKYPAIEDELIKMIESGDFDTKVASSRVDTVIRLADVETATTSRIIPKEEMKSALIENPVEILSPEENEITVSPSDSEEIFDTDDFPMEIVAAEEEQVYTPEDIDYEELESSTIEESEEDYVPYEDIRSEEFEEDKEISTESGISLATEELELDTEPDTVTENILESGRTEDISPIKLLEEENNIYEEEELAAKRKLHIRRTIQIIGIVMAVVALIFIIKFVMIHWQTILIVAGILAVLAILFVWFKRKRK